MSKVRGVLLELLNHLITEKESRLASIMIQRINESESAIRKAISEEVRGMRISHRPGESIPVPDISIANEHGMRGYIIGWNYSLEQAEKKLRKEKHDTH